MPPPTSEVREEPTTPVIQDFIGSAGLQRLEVALVLVNEYSATYLDVRDYITYESDAIYTQELSNAEVGLHLAMNNLKVAITSRTLAETGLWEIATWTFDDLTIHNVMEMAAYFKPWTQHIAWNIEAVLSFLENTDVLEQVGYELKDISLEISYALISYYKSEIQSLEFADTLIAQRDGPDFIGPRQASLVRFFPTANELTHLLLAAPEEEEGEEIEEESHEVAEEEGGEEEPAAAEPDATIEAAGTEGPDSQEALLLSYGFLDRVEKPAPQDPETNRHQQLSAASEDEQRDNLSQEGELALEDDEKKVSTEDESKEGGEEGEGAERGEPEPEPETQRHERAGEVRSKQKFLEWMLGRVAEEIPGQQTEKRRWSIDGADVHEHYRQ